MQNISANNIISFLSRHAVVDILQPWSVSHRALVAAIILDAPKCPFYFIETLYIYNMQNISANNTISFLSRHAVVDIHYHFRQW